MATYRKVFAMVALGMIGSVALAPESASATTVAEVKPRTSPKKKPARGRARAAARSSFASLNGRFARGVPVTLQGSRPSVEKMFNFAQSHDLKFMDTPADVDSAVAHGHLIQLESDGTYELSGGVGFDYVTPEALNFVVELSQRYSEVCGTPMVVTSAARPKSRQPRNANPLSVHPTGIAVDLRRPAAGPCLTWLRDTLLQMEADGKIEATEERHPVHLHVAVLADPGSAPLPGLVSALKKNKPLDPEMVAMISGPSITPGLVDSLFRMPVMPLAWRDASAEVSEIVTGVSAGEVETSPVASAKPAGAAKPARKRKVESYSGNEYVVKQGDSLWDIAQRLGFTVEALRSANGLGKRPVLKPGKVLKLPPKVPSTRS